MTIRNFNLTRDINARSYHAESILNFMRFIAIVIAISRNISAITWKIRYLLEVPRTLQLHRTKLCDSAMQPCRRRCSTSILSMHGV